MDVDVMYRRMAEAVIPLSQKAFRDSVFWAPEIFNERWAEKIAEMIWACAEVAVEDTEIEL